MVTNNYRSEPIREFTNDLNTTNWESIFDNNPNANPNITYDQEFTAKLDAAMNEHFPIKTVKFNKYKHKKTKWITQGILNKIKHRDILYKKVHSLTPDHERYDELAQRLHDCA